MKIYICYREDETVAIASTSKLGESEYGQLAEVEVDDSIVDDIFNNTNDYIYQNGQIVKTINLSYYRSLKEAELNEAHKDAINRGFDFIIDNQKYHFPLDGELSFQSASKLFEAGLVDSMMWSVTKDGEPLRISINKETLDNLILAEISHKADIISKYRDVLMPIVNSATTIEAINAVKW